MNHFPSLDYPATVRHDLVDLRFDQAKSDSPCSSLKSEARQSYQANESGDDSSFDTVCLLDENEHDGRRVRSTQNTSKPSTSHWSFFSSSRSGTILADPQFKSDFHVEYRLWSQLKKHKSTNSESKYKENLLFHSSLLAKDKSSAKMLPVTGRKDSNGTLASRASLGSTTGESQRLVNMPSNSHCFQETEEDDDELEDSSSLSSSSWSVYKGIIYSSLSSVFFSLSAVIVKYLKDVHPGELAVCRFFGIFLLSIPLLVYHDLDPFGPRELRHLLVLRGLAGATSLYLRFHAFHYLPIADASVIIFSVPVFVSVFAWFYLKEPCGMFQILTISLAMLGLVMTTKLPFLFGPSDSSFSHSKDWLYYRPSGPLPWHNVSSSVLAEVHNAESLSESERRAHHLYGVLSALSSLFFASAVFIFIRKARGAHYAVIMFNFGWVAILETCLLTTLLNGFSMPRTPFEWYLIVLLGIFSFCGQLLLTRSLQLEQAGPVSVVRATTDIALAFLWQLIIFKETPDAWSILGALLVSSCIVLISLRKWLSTLSDKPRMFGLMFK